MRRMTAARFTPRLIAFALVGVAMAAWALALLYWGRDQAIQGEALGYAARLASSPSTMQCCSRRPTSTSSPCRFSCSTPCSMPSAWRTGLPYMLVATALVLLCAGLFFALARRRVGDLLGGSPDSSPALLRLRLGNDVTPLRLPSLIALAAGLGALIALEKRNRGGDIVAATLLTASVASHPVGLSFLAAAGVLVAFRPWPWSWRSAWLLLIPAAVSARGGCSCAPPAQAVVFPTRPIDVVHFAVDSWTSITASVSGAGRRPRRTHLRPSHRPDRRRRAVRLAGRPPGDAARPRPGEPLGRLGGAGRRAGGHPSIPR